LTLQISQNIGNIAQKLVGIRLRVAAALVN
jgi:hypothetical protein